MSTTMSEQTISMLPAGQGKSYLLLGTEGLTFKASASQTGGAFMTVEATIPPGSGPPLHMHQPQELFYILEGEFEFRDVLGESRRAGLRDRLQPGPRVGVGHRRMSATLARVALRAAGVAGPAMLVDSFFAALGVSNAHVVPYGFGAADGETVLYIPPDSEGNHAPTMAPMPGWETVTVRVRRLDDCLDEWRVDRVDLCTRCNEELFFSHRRDRGLTGRQAGVAWLI